MEKYVMLFEEFVNESSNISTDSKMLYKTLVPLFEPEYNVESPSGPNLETIEIRFNKKTRLSNIENIIISANWYISKRNGQDDSDTSKIEIKPTYSNSYLKSIPEYLYHVNPSKFDKQILKQGLIPKNNMKKGILYPPRIYLSKDIKTLKNIVKELNYIVGEKDWTLWKIKTSNVKINKLYIDYTVNQSHSNPSAVYIQATKIPAKALEIDNHIKV
jgi:hypothetical protein